MRGHEIDGIETLRPAASRINEHEDDHAHAVPALMGGRSDALTADSLTHLQRTAGNAAVAQRLAGEQDEEERSPVHDVVGRGGGRPLDADTRTDMESRLGADFSDVRIHDDAKAHDSAVAVNAHAYTVGSDVVFQRDRFDPSSAAGKVTLAHELTHVVQQRSGPVDGTPASGGVRISDPSDRFEREASSNAERVMSAPAPVQALHTDHAGHDHAVQREAPEEEEVQTLPADAPVQRAAEEEEEVQTLSADTPIQRAAPEEDEEPA